MKRILVVEDEPVIRKALQQLLERNQYSVKSVGSVQEALEENPSSFNIVLADLRLPGAEGTDLIAEAAPVPVLIMTSHASVRSAVQSMKLGAADYISKPFDHDELLIVIERSLRHNRLYAQNNAMKHDLHNLFPYDSAITESSVLHNLINKLASLGDADRHVLLHGECGTGKELLARISHRIGERKEMQCVLADLTTIDLQCNEAELMGLAETIETNQHNHRIGMLQEANGGTLIVRHLELLSQQAQERLYSYLKSNTESGSAQNSHSHARNLRLIALSISSPESLLSNNRMIPELLSLFADNIYRVPPLRERRVDIPMLAHHYLRQISQRYDKSALSLSDETLSAMQAYHWPGNVAELVCVLERAVMLRDAEEILPIHVGLDLANNEHGISQALNLDSYFRYVVLQYQHALSETDLAAMLGISRKALWERRQKMNLLRPQSPYKDSAHKSDIAAEASAASKADQKR